MAASVESYQFVMPTAEGLGLDRHDSDQRSARQRLDKWLWHARVVKARSAAAELVESGRVRINGERQKSPGHGIKIGDVLTVSLDRIVRLMKVTDFAERRGNADAARLLYEDVAEKSDGNPEA